MTPRQLGDLIDRLGPALVLYARQWAAAPEDVVQDAFLRLVEARRPPDDPAAWLFAVVRNRAMDLAKADEWVARLETESREPYAKRNEIVAASGVKSGEIVADVGAGTGLFTAMFAAKVGRGGHVYAVDIARRRAPRISDA